MSAVGMSRRFILPAAATLTCGLLLCVLDSGRCVAPEPPAVDDFVVQSWQTDEGLPGNTVNGVLQDQKGYIWLATIGGLVRFDGVTFKLFASPLIARLAARNIRALAETADSTLLMLPAVGGVVQLKDGQFSLHPAGEGLAGKQMQTLFVDRGGAIWIGMEDGQVRRWQDGKSFDFAPTNVLTIRNRVSFAADNEGRVWIASGGFACCYRDGKLAWLNNDLEADGYAVVASSHSGGIWIWKNTRLLKWEGGQLSTVSTNLPWVALGGVVREMFEDSSGALWIGTGAHGLFRLCRRKIHPLWKRRKARLRPSWKMAKVTSGLAPLGGGINRLRPKLFHLYNTKSGLPEDVSDGVCADERGDVWLANRGGGVARISNGQVSVLGLQTGSHKFRAYSVCADDRGALWVNEDEGGLYRFPRDHPDQAQTVSNSLTGKITPVHVLFKSRARGHLDRRRPEFAGLFSRRAAGKLCFGNQISRAASAFHH